MKRFKILLFALMVTSLGLIAQTANDAITLGQYYHGGTARYMSMGGAFNALGGDFSTLSVNPAGIGIYRSNEFTFTTDLQFNNTTTGISAAGTQMNGVSLASQDRSISDTKSNFNINSMGYVGSNEVGDNGLIRVNFGMGFNRLKNYHKAYRAEALGASYSLTDSWSQFLEGSTTGAYVADQAYLMNRFDNGNGIELMSPLIEGAQVDNIKDVVETGRINEWVFSMGGNVSHTIYFGGTVGIQDISLKKEYFQTEYFLNTAHSDAFYDGKSYHRYFDNGASEQAFEALANDYFSYYSEEETSGIGLNAKFGVIVRPLDMFRFGVAIHTPTINYLSVDHYGDLTNNTAYYNENNELVDPSGSGDAPGEGYEDVTSYDYRTISPYKVHASAALILGHNLAVDAEVDMVDYSTMKIKDADGRSYEFEATNKAISEMYKIAYNARLGAELRLAPTIALRAGMAYYGSPYDDNFYSDAAGNLQDAADYVGDRFDYSAGFGFRSGDFFWDLAYIRSIQDNKTFVFDSAISPYEYYEMDLDHTYNRFMMTLGFKF